MDNEILVRLNQALGLAGRKVGFSKKREIAAFLGYSSTHYSEIINGKTPLTENFLDHISEHLNINSDWIRTGEGHALKDVAMGTTVNDDVEEYQQNKTVPYFLYKELQDRYEAVVRENESLRIKLNNYEKGGKKKVANS